MTTTKNFSYILQQLIEELAITDKRFAEASGIKLSTLSNYLSGKTVPNWYTLQNIVTIFKANPVWLLTGQGPTFQTDPAEPPGPGSEPEALPALTPAEREMETFVRLMRENTDPEIRKGLMAKFGVKVGDEKKLDSYLQGISEGPRPPGVHEPDLDFGKDI